MKVNLFPTFKLIFQVSLIALCMSTIATVCTVLLWVFDFTDKQTMFDLVFWFIVILICTIVYGFMAYLAYDDNYKMPNEEKPDMTEAYDDMTGEQTK